VHSLHTVCAAAALFAAAALVTVVAGVRRRRPQPLTDEANGSGELDFDAAELELELSGADA